MKSAYQLLKDAFSRIFAFPKTYLQIIAIPAAIAVVVSYIEPLTDLEGNYIWNSSIHMYQYIAVMIVFSIASMFMTIAGILVSENTSMSTGEAYKAALSKVLSYIAMVIVFSLVITIAFIALIIPALWLSISLMFASYFLLLRNASAVDSIKMSYSLVKGRWWNVFGKTLMFWLLYCVIAIPVYIILLFLGILVSDGIAYALMSIASVFGSLLLFVFMYEFFLDLEKTQSIQVQAAPAAEVPVAPAATV